MLVVSASISFGLGRVFVHFRNKRQAARKEQLQKLAAQALRDLPPEEESQNKAKRKRQLRRAQRAEADHSR